MSYIEISSTFEGKFYISARSCIILYIVSFHYIAHRLRVMRPVLLLYDRSIQRVLLRHNNNNNNNNNNHNHNHNHNQFLGVLETVRQEERMSLECATKEFLRRMSIIRSSPLSDHNWVTTSNQFALPVLGYLMWTQR